MENETYIQKYNKEWKNLEVIKENEDSNEWLLKLDYSEKVLF